MTPDEKRARNREYQRRWRLKNSSKKREHQKKWREANTEQQVSYRREYYLKNKHLWKEQRERNRRQETDLRLRRTYGITIDEFEQMLKAQDHACKICHEPFKRPRDRHIDHCHITGKVRGVLCDSCNLGLGRFKDSEELLERAKEYLRSSK